MSEITKICLTIAGVDPSGGAGIIADIKTFSAFGCFATAVISSVTFQNTQGVFGAEHQTAESVRKQIEPILDDYKISALKTGMLPTQEIIDAVAKVVDENKLSNFVVDPVVRSTSGFDLIDDSALKSLKDKLFPLAIVITPNIPEAERISQIKIKNESDLKKAGKIIRAKGARNVLIKGGHFDRSSLYNDSKAVIKDYLFTEENIEVFEAEYIETDSTHGTGCTLAAAITANLALGHTLSDSVRIAKDFVNKGIKNSPNIGKGHSPIAI